MKLFAYLMSAIMLVAIANAKTSSTNNSKVSEQAKKAQEEREKKIKELHDRDAKIKEFLDSKDTNHDGSVSKAEYIAGETDPKAAEAKFNEFDKNHDRVLEKSEIAALLGLTKTK